MSDLSSLSESADALPAVHLEVRQGNASPASYPLSDVGFLVGSVPGCDLRLPGTGLPPVLCLILRRPGGVTLRKLAPTQVVLINGKVASQAELRDGDRVTIGAVDLLVQVQGSAQAAYSGQMVQEQAALVKAAQRELHTKIQTFREEVLRFEQEQHSAAQERLRQGNALDDRQRILEDQVKRLQEEKAHWEEQRQDIERQLLEQGRASNEKEVAGAFLDLKQRESDLEGRARQIREREQELQARLAEQDQQKQEQVALRQEMADLRRQLYERYQERRDRLAGLQEAVNKAARKVQERKHELEDEEARSVLRRQEDAARQAELEDRAAQLAEQLQRHDEQRRLFEQEKASFQQEYEKRNGDLRDREDTVARLKNDLAQREQRHQADLVRLDRLRGELEEREQALAGKSQEIAVRFTQMRRDSDELEDQIAHLESWQAELAEQAEQLAKQRDEQESTSQQLVQRTAALEGQQATLAALRTRLERMREEVRREEQVLGEQRARQETAEAELHLHLQESLQLRARLDGEQGALDLERQQIAERSAVLDAAVQRLKQAQEGQAAEKERLAGRQHDLDQLACALAEREVKVEEQERQLQEGLEKLEAERQALRERAQELALAEQAREKLQEQLRRRAEELAAQQQALADQLKDFETRSVGLDARRLDLENQTAQAQAALAQQRQAFQAQVQEVESEKGVLVKQAEELRAEAARIADERKALAEERAQAKIHKQEVEEAVTRQRAMFELQKQALADAEAGEKANFEVLRCEAREIVQRLPDLELRAATALERLGHGREQLREHLAEVHAYANQCQEELEKLRDQVRGDAERVQQQDQALRRALDQHRLAVADFRQQIIDWQAQVVDKKRLLVKDESLLERRQARVAEQARKVDVTVQELAQKAEDLQAQERDVQSRRQEMDRHLTDMQSWYRRKLRELSGVDQGVRTGPPGARTAEPFALEAAADDDAEPGNRDILSMTGPVDPADKKLGNLLRALGLVDAEALTALLAESRRQRRSLRQVLLSSGAVTLYQLAAIEAGNVAGLMLGPVRVVDRLRSTPREAVYRVFDPRRGQELVLRHMAEAEMLVPGHARDYFESFTRAIIAHPHLLKTLEVLDIDGRPGVLQEWPSGLVAAELPPLASVPGVSFRLLSQAALGLSTIHVSGLVHGHLSEHQLLLGCDGVLRITGLGEPCWLATPPYSDRADSRGDLHALGKIAAGWCTSGVRKGAKTKPLPELFVKVIHRLTGDGPESYSTASHLLDDLDRISTEIPANAEAWDRLVKYVREHATTQSAMRLSA